MAREPLTSNQRACGEPATQSQALTPAEAESRAGLEQRQAVSRSQRQIDAGSLPSNPVRTLTTRTLLHILRNPWGKTADEIRRARIEAADEIEYLQRELSKRAADVANDGS